MREHWQPDDGPDGHGHRGKDSNRGRESENDRGTHYGREDLR